MQDRTKNERTVLVSKKTMHYICVVKRTLKTYFSIVLLACLAFQFVPLSMLHSHDDHHEATSCHNHDSEHHGTKEVSLTANDSDTDHFSNAEDCDVCEVVKSLHQQSHLFLDQVESVRLFVATESNTAWTEHHSATRVQLFQGRAPPIV